MNEDNPKKEKIPLFFVFEEDGQIKTEVFPETNNFTLYGFLNVFVKNLEEELKEDLRPRED